MNVYDQAHLLARSIKECEEYKQYDSLKKQIALKPELDAMIKDFQQKQFEIQAMQMAGQAPDEDVMATLQQSMGIIMTDPLAAQYMQAEMRFALMMQDVMQIVNEPITGPANGGAN